MARTRTSYNYPLNVILCADEYIGNRITRNFSDEDIARLEKDRFLRATFEYVLQVGGFTEKEIKVVKLYYEDVLTVKEIASKLDSSTSNIEYYRNTILSKLMDKENVAIIKVGIEQYFKNKLEKAVDDAKDEAYQTGFNDGYDKAISTVADKHKDEVPDIPLEDVKMSVKLFNICKRAGLTCLNDIAMLNRVKLRKTGIGKKSIMELIDILNVYGLDTKELKIAGKVETE